MVGAKVDAQQSQLVTGALNVRFGGDSRVSGVGRKGCFGHSSYADSRRGANAPTTALGLN